MMMMMIFTSLQPRPVYIYDDDGYNGACTLSLWIYIIERKEKKTHLRIYQRYPSV